MDPQLKSILTSILLAIATSATTWGVAHGLVPAADQNVIANDIVTFIFGAVSALLAWYKTRQHTPTAQIAAVNDADNGVKVVPATSPAPTVKEPLK